MLAEAKRILAQPTIYFYLSVLLLEWSNHGQGSVALDPSALSWVNVALLAILAVLVCYAVQTIRTRHFYFFGDLACAYVAGLTYVGLGQVGVSSAVAGLAALIILGPNLFKAHRVSSITAAICVPIALIAGFLSGPLLL